ncbi:MAG: DedA family protein [Negativicutes bacterium]|jgi:membrane protein DedA with SNARE-associated domain
MQEFLLSNIEKFGYLAIFICTFIEGMCIPLVSELILGFAGFLVFKGTLMFLPTAFSAWAGSFCGSFFIYCVFRRGGRPLVYRYGHYIRLTPRRFDKFSEWFERFGPILIIPWRQIPVLRTKISIVAGIFDLNIYVFSALTAVGIAVWTTAALYVSYSFGENWQQLLALGADLSNFIVYVLIFSVIGAAIVFYWRKKEKHKKRSRHADRHHNSEQ